MARITQDTIDALVHAAAMLEAAEDYQWGHMGSCNCGFLAREVSRLDKSVIHRAALQRYGNWTEQLNDYCPTSGLLIDDLITTLLDAGFDIDDLKHLETLSKPEVLHSLPSASRDLKHNVKKDAVTYMRAWAALLLSELSPRTLSTAITSEVPEPMALL